MVSEMGHPCLPPGQNAEFRDVGGPVVPNNSFWYGILQTRIGIPLFTFEDPVRTNSSSQPTYSGIHHGLGGLVAEVGTDSYNFVYVDPGDRVTWSQGELT